VGLYDAAGKSQAGLSVMSNGLSGLNLNDSAGVTRAVLAVLPDGSPGLDLFDESGRPLVSLP